MLCKNSEVFLYQMSLGDLKGTYKSNELLLLLLLVVVV